MFQEKEMYFFEPRSNQVNSQKVVIIPKMTTGEILTDNMYDIIEENTRMTLFESKIIPRDMVSCKLKVGNNYYFENSQNDHKREHGVCADRLSQNICN